MKLDKVWLSAAIQRSVRTICQTALGVAGTATLLGQVDWVAVGSASILAGILSLLTSVATGLPEVK
jgi:hypothetical protein